MKRALVVAALVCGAARGAHAGDPDRVYHTIETDHFVIYYWDPMEDVARRIAVTAERSHRVLVPALDHAPTEKTLVFIADDTDNANGFAGVLPRNAIQLYATGPNSFSELDDHDDWLYGLVAHEYTHILHLDTMSGLPVIYNKIFGKTWAPNQIMPRWIIEGIATYEESKRSAGGRNRGSRFDEVIRTALHGDKEMRIDEISGAPRRYPRGNAAYIYGSHFLDYVFNRFGDDKLRDMSHTAGGWAPPFAINRQIAKVVGKPFTELYDDWRLYMRDHYGMQEMAAERRGLVTGKPITHSAESNLLAHYSVDGKTLYWLQYDGKTLPAVRAMPVGGDESQKREIVQIDAMGPWDLLPDGSIVYEQGRQYRRDYAFEDLFRWDAQTRQTVRLTTGRRARDPAVSPDGRTIAFSQNEHSESVLAVMAAGPDQPSRVVWRGQRYDQAYQPVWSPDGTRIAFSAWRKGGYRDILVLDIASGNVQELMRDRAVDQSPVWSADGRYIYFTSDRTGISNVYAYDTTDQTLWQVTNVLGGAYQPDISPDGTRIAFEAAVTVGGYDLFELPIDRESWLPARDYVDDRPPPVDVKDDEVAITKARPYRPLETLAPQSWILQYDLANKTANIQTGGSDAVGLHGYALAVGLDANRGDVNVGASYGYSGWRQVVRLATSRTVVQRSGWRIDGVNRRFREEDWSATVSSAIPFESRPDASWTMSFDYDIDWFRLTEPPEFMLDPTQRAPLKPPTDYVQAGIGTRLAFSNVKSTTFGLGAGYGFDASVSLRFDHPAIGATYRNITASYATDLFRRLWGTTPTLSLRLVGSLRIGDLPRTGTFALGGTPPQDIVNSIVNSIRTGSSGYLRGYPARTVVGNQYHLLNLEYRQELFAIERGLSTLPVYLRRVHMALLSDTGTAFDTEFDFDKHFRSSLGAALRVDAFFGYFVPGTFEIGYAHGLTSQGIGETWLLLTGSL